MEKRVDNIAYLLDTAEPDTKFAAELGFPVLWITWTENFLSEKVASIYTICSFATSDS